MCSHLLRHRHRHHHQYYYYYYYHYSFRGKREYIIRERFETTIFYFSKKKNTHKILHDFSTKNFLQKKSALKMDASPTPTSAAAEKAPPLPSAEKEEDPLKPIKDQIIAYDPIAGEEADGGDSTRKECDDEHHHHHRLTKEQESEALPTLKDGKTYTCFTCATRESYKWFNGKKEETAGEVICKKCYHKELVDLSDRICAVRAHRVPFFDFGRTFRARCERQSRALFAVLTNENRFFCIHVYNRRAVLQKLRDAGTDRKKTTRSVCAKSATRRKRKR